MHLFIASGLLIVCGIVDATIYNPRTQTFNQLMERRQRSIGLQYPQGYHYNPIEPSINDLYSLNEALDSRINTYNPIYQHVEMSNHEVNSVPRTHSYQSKNPLYDSEYVTVQDIPSLFPEDSYDYKYLGLPLNKYLTQPSTTESGIPINLVAIRKTSVFGYRFPSYKSPYSSDSDWNLGSNIPNTIYGDAQSVETDPDTLKVSSPTVRIVQLLPETIQQDPIPMSTDYSLLLKLLSGNLNEAKDSAKNESIYEITQETPTEDESDSLTTEETQTENQSNILVIEENLTEDESNSITTEETQTGDESNSITTEETQTEDNSNILMYEENPIKNIFNFITIEENLTEDESNSLTTEETPTENELNSQVFDSITTEAESNSIATEDESNTTEETQDKDDESKSTTSQETTTAFKLNDELGKNWYLNSDENIKTKELFKEYEKFITPQLFTSVENFPAKYQSNLLSDEDTNQKFQPQLVNGIDTFEEYDK